METDVVIIGGGCIGLSVAKNIAERSDQEVAVLDKEHQLAQHQSGRNSGVLHPGFNYKPGSMKARFAREGTRRIKEYCAQNAIPCQEFGVVVIAQSDKEEHRLERLAEQAEANGVKYSLVHSQEAITEHEPHALGQAALLAPEAASIDSQQYVHSLGKDVFQAGGSIYLGHEVKDIKFIGGQYHVQTNKGTFEASKLVNAAGLYADRLAHGLGVGKQYQIIPFRGEYYELDVQNRHVCSSMIYPTPDPQLPFLGVHFTRRTDERVIVGPNAVLAFGRQAYNPTDVNPYELFETLSYPGFRRLLTSPKMISTAVSELGKSYSKQRFTAAARHLIPELKSDALKRSYAGIRAQLVTREGRLVKEPLIIQSNDAVHVLNAVSPGLTCSLPVGEHISDKILF